jgi:hypothetical protein
MGFPFARVEASPLGCRLASQRGRIEFAFATDDSVRLPLLSTPPHGDAVTVSYQAGVGLPEEDLHLPELNTLARAHPPACAGSRTGTPSTHPIPGDELRALRRLERKARPRRSCLSAKAARPFTAAGFARKLARAAVTGAPAHAPRVRICPRQHGPRHPRKPKGARASVYYQRDRLYCAGGRTGLGISGGLSLPPSGPPPTPSPSSRSFDPALAVARYSRRKTDPVSLPSGRNSPSRIARG